MTSNQKIIKKFLKGECSVEQLHEVYRLFSTKEFEQEIFDHLEEEWDSLDEKDKYISYTDFEKLYEETKKKSGIKKTFTFRALKIAGSIALICTLSLLTWKLFPKEYLRDVLVYNEVTTQRGEIRIVELSDGSQITMNAASKLRYPKKITEENRSIFIEGGAYFQVNEQLASLLIHVGEIKAEVSGLSFNVSAYPDEDEIVIAVEKGGSIKTIIPWFNLNAALLIKEGEDAQYQSSPIDDNSTIALIVNEDEYFSYNRRIRKFEHDEFEESREHFAWVEGKVFFHEIGMEKMLKQLARTFDLDFDLSGCIDEKMIFSGEYDRNSLTTILNHTSELMDAEYDVNEYRVAITGNCNSQF